MREFLPNWLGAARLKPEAEDLSGGGGAASGRGSALAEAPADSSAGPQQYGCSAAQNQHISRGHGSLTYMATKCSLRFYICASPLGSMEVKRKAGGLDMKKPLLQVKEWLGLNDQHRAGQP